MKSSPQLTVVIPTHDTRALTLACLESLYRNAGEIEGDLEVIVVDDGSRDGTAEEVRLRFPRVSLLRNEKPAGFTVAANRGLRHSRADLLLLLNSDTEVPPGSLRRLQEAFRDNPRLGIAGAALRYPDGSPQWSGGNSPGLTWLFGLASGLPTALGRLPGYRFLRPPRGRRGSVDWVTGAAMALRRETWDEVGPFDESFLFYAQDLDLCLRARHKGWEVAVVSGFEVLHHHGATIGNDPGAVTPAGSVQHPELLWTDLLRWARRERGAEWTRRAAIALWTGGLLRLVGRGLRYPFLPAARRQHWSRDTRSFYRALAALSSDKGT